MSLDIYAYIYICVYERVLLYDKDSYCHLLRDMALFFVSDIISLEDADICLALFFLLDIDIIMLIFISPLFLLSSLSLL